MRADIHDGQEHERSIHGPDTEAQDQSPHHSHLTCNTRPVHTVGSNCKEPTQRAHFRVAPNNRQGNALSAAKSLRAAFGPYRFRFFGKKFADGRITIADRGPRDVVILIWVMGRPGDANANGGSDEPTNRAPGFAARARLKISAAASRTASSLARSSRTPPTSDLCTMSGD